MVANQHGPALLYRNSVDPSRHWVQFRLTGTRSNRSAIGAEVTVTWDGKRQRQVVAAGTGFSSQTQRRLHFGLGASTEVDSVRIRWPSGSEQMLSGDDLDIDRLHDLMEPTR
jgi:hypothetical protein